MEFCLKWVHMARYGLILRLDGALWHTIISGPLLTQKRAMESSNIRKKVKHLLELAKSNRFDKVLPSKRNTWEGLFGYGLDNSSITYIPTKGG